MKVEGVSNITVPLQQQKAKAGSLPEEKQGAGVKGAGAGEDLSSAKTRPEDRAGEGPGAVLDRALLDEAVEKANKTMETYNTELRFSIHEASGEMMVKVINTKDGTVIREIPPEKVLNFVAHIKKMLGIIIDKFI